MIDLNSAQAQSDNDNSARRKYDEDAIARDLAASAGRWVPELFPAGHISDDRREWRVGDIGGCAPRAGGGGGSTAINLLGEHAGGWRDWAFSDAKGGPLSTIKERLGLRDGEVYEKAVEILHQVGYGGAYLLGEATRANGHANVSGAGAAVVGKDEHEIKFALDNSTSIRGTGAEAYLLKRTGVIPPAALGDDPDLLFNPSLVRSRREARGHPALVSRLRYPNGRRSGGLHRTFLLPDGSHHLGDDIAKMMMGKGRCKGAIVMLGPTDGVLGVGTGIETTLAAAHYHNVPAWAAVSDGGMGEFAAFLRANNGCVAAGPDGELVRLQRLLAFADRGDSGEKAGWKLHSTARALGIAAEMYLPIGPDDFADDLAKGLPAAARQPEPAENARTGELPLRTGVPEIQVGGGRLPENVDDTERYLEQYDKEVFQRGDFLMRPAKAIIQIAHNRKAFAKRLVRIGPQHLIDRLTRIIDFQKYDARKDEWFSINCPADVAAALLVRNGMWNLLPHIRGIVTAPTLRSDGTLLDRPGYDASMSILYDPGDVNYAEFEIPIEPTKEQARKALDMLISLILEFPFVDEEGNDATGQPSPSRSVSLSHILSGSIRPSLSRVPLHGYNATASGTGKSLLVDAASMIATGHECPVISPGGNPEEMEKRLGAALLAGDTNISFDNCETPLGGETLNQAITQSIVQIRILGKSELHMIPSDTLISATGNNLTIVGDMGRRTIMAMLDPKMEKPETRIFKSENPVVRIRKDRARYVAAALTVLRAFHVAGRPSQSTSLGGFEDWSGWVRDALIWLDEPDPVATQEQARREDPRRRDLAAVLHQWKEVIGEREVSVKRLIESATEQCQFGLDLNYPTMKHSDFRETLLVVAGEKGNINSRRLGNWLRTVRGRVVDRMRIEQAPMLDGNNRWRLITLD
jgi:hypothetical protein